jgi:hypothetical protein
MMPASASGTHSNEIGSKLQHALEVYRLLIAWTLAVLRQFDERLVAWRSQRECQCPCSVDDAVNAGELQEAIQHPLAVSNRSRGSLMVDDDQRGILIGGQAHEPQKGVDRRDGSPFRARQVRRTRQSVSISAETPDADDPVNRCRLDARDSADVGDETVDGRAPAVLTAHDPTSQRRPEHAVHS